MSGLDSTPSGGAMGFDSALRELGEALAAHPKAATAAWQRFADDCMAAGAATMAAGSSEAREPAEPVIP